MSDDTKVHEAAAAAFIANLCAIPTTDVPEDEIEDLAILLARTFADGRRHGVAHMLASEGRIAAEQSSALERIANEQTAALERIATALEKHGPTTPKPCEHDTNRTWSLLSGQREWCSDCGAFRNRTEPDDGPWHLPRHKP